MAIRFLTCQEHLAHGRLRVAIRRELEQAPMKQHRHEFFEIVIILSGSGVHVTGSFYHHIESGDVLFLDSHRTHGYEQTRGLNLINILVRNDMAKQVNRNLHGNSKCILLNSASCQNSRGEYTTRVHLLPQELHQIEQWIFRLEEQSQLRARASRMLEMSYLTVILDDLSRKHARWTTVDLRKSRGRSQENITRVLSWIEKNLGTPVNLTIMAEQAGMSKRTFQRTFSETLGVSPHAYLMERRIRRATVRFEERTSNTSVTEIAYECGFQDSNYFSRCFHHLIGVTPKEYRKKRHS